MGAKATVKGAGAPRAADASAAGNTRARGDRWREAALVLAVLAAALCLFYYQVLFLGRTILPVQAPGVMGTAPPYGFPGQIRTDTFHPDLGASAWQMEPWALKVGRAYAAGHFPLWNETQGFGAPFLANALSGGLDVLRLPLLMSGSPLVWDGYYLARVFLGALAAYLCARALRLNVAAGLALALAYVCSGHFVMFENNFWLEAYFLLPVILLGTELVLAGRARLGFAVTAVAVALDLLVGMPEVTLLVFLFCGAYGGYRLLLLVRRGDRRAWWGPARTLAGAWVVGVALAAPLLLPLFEFTAQASQSAGGRAHLGQTYEPLRNLTVWFMPFLTDALLNPPITTIVTTYVGATVVVLALYGLYPARTRLYRTLVPFAALAAALLFAKTFGVPGINAVGRLPGLNVTWIQKWGAPIATFCLALLAAAGVHRLATEKPHRVAATAALGGFGALAALGLWLNRAGVAGVSAAHLWATAGVACGCAVAVWAIALFGPRRPAAWRGFACCGVLLLELFLYGQHAVYQDRYDRLTPAPYVAFLQGAQADGGPSRIYAMDGLLWPNTAAAYDIDDIRSLDSLYSNRYLTYVRDFVAPGVVDRFLGVTWASNEGPTRLRGNPWFDLAGARYVVTPPDSGAALRGPAASNLNGAILAAAGTMTPNIGAQSWTIDGVTKPVLFAHPPATIRYPLTVTSERPVL
ncbi:MAG TPA: YfhO family protein, partial [Thermomicrobiales bacterium]|nr:YfhO family protein [Thermomicrobiales bacterium]